MPIAEQMDLEICFQQYADLVKAGRTVEAIAQFYDEYIIQTENTDEAVCGKERLKANEEANLSRVHALQTDISKVVMNQSQGMVWGEMCIHFENENQAKVKLTEAFYQQWQNGKNHSTKVLL